MDSIRNVSILKAAMDDDYQKTAANNVEAENLKTFTLDSAY